MIITFSIMGIKRVRGRGEEYAESLTAFFGTDEWQQCSTKREYIDLYRSRLEQFNYYIQLDVPEHSEITMRNKKNAEVYSLIFASKHPLGEKFWREVKKMIEKIRHRSPRLL